MMLRGSMSISAQSSENCDVLTTEDCSGSDDDDSKQSDMAEIPPEFRNCWKAAVKTPQDFTLWSKVVAYAERMKDLAACRKAFDALLTCFPLAQIYWKKYADIEQHLGSIEETEKIFIRALKSNPLNVTLWTSYISFLLKKEKKKLPKPAEQLQGVFGQAIDACGLEYRSDELWSLYIDYEIKGGRIKNAMALYIRLLNIPTQQYQLHFERFKIFIATHSPVEFLTTEELNTIHAKLQVDNDNDQVSSEDVPSGDIADSLTESNLQEIRQYVLDTGNQMYLLNKEQVKKRCAFEEGIKRLYFFATPLSVKQLQNWRKYLNFEISQGHHERVVVLFERCLMPCVKYEEFWLLYACYMEKHSVEAARSIFERACRIHLPLKFTLHLHWALFEEKHGQLNSSREILSNLEIILPGVVMVRLRRVNFERRNGNLQEAERLLREAAQNSSGSEMAFYTVKLARLLLKLKSDPEKARDVLIGGLKKEPNSPFLHECLLEMEISRDAGDDVMLCVERALNSNIHDAIKGILSQRRLEFLEDCGNSMNSLFNAYEEHQILLEKQEELKRKANDKDEDKNDKKVKSKSDNSSVIEDVPIPGVSEPVIPSATSEKSVSAENTTGSSTPPTNVNVPTKSFYHQQTQRSQVFVPRPAVRPYVHPFLSHMSRGFAPLQRMAPPMPPHHMGGPPPPMPPHHMGGPPPPMPPHHMGGPHNPPPPYNYGPWFQNFGGFNNPQPWNYNRYYPPF
ncbi:pre-mRNA-processing factor 39-like isoform X2 [Hyla sarda]|uniref:pre-mRNA-processing factor 39-like isoform X2 n=1 Tax=Hyla sarda TaxID=327740 RepID=UPI0024C453AE|nr:pre-mRNA-processing factor 39-like isoform X2 [Hyla sarda]